MAGDYTPKWETTLPTIADLLLPEYESFQTTLLQDITDVDPGITDELYLADNSECSQHGGVVHIEDTGERIRYSGIGDDGTGDYVTVAERGVDGGSAPAAATAGDAVVNVISYKNFEHPIRELIKIAQWLDDIPYDIDWTVDGEVTNQIDVHMQFQSVNGNNIAREVVFMGYRSLTTAKTYYTTTGGSMIIAGAPDDDGVLLWNLDNVVSDNEGFLLLTDSAGLCSVTINHSVAGTFYLNIVMPLGNIVVSPAITFV
jgi:hypothetical protein